MYYYKKKKMSNVNKSLTDWVNENAKRARIGAETELIRSGITKKIVNHLTNGGKGPIYPNSNVLPKNNTNTNNPNLNLILK